MILTNIRLSQSKQLNYFIFTYKENIHKQIYPMKLHQSRSQLIRTSLSGNRKNQLTYNRLPVSYEKINLYKKQLIREAQTPAYQKRTTPIPLTSHKLFRQGKETLTKFNQTEASTFNRARGISHRIISTSQKFRSTGRQSFFHDENYEDLQRPSTEFRGHRNPQVRIRVNAYSPLEVINTKLSEENNESLVIGRQNSHKSFGSKRHCQSQMSKRIPHYSLERKKNFLKKGSSFDKSLVINILKSKFKQKIASGTANYANAQSNSAIYQAIKKEIPHEFRDIIGPQEMLRMSKILSGINLKTVDMNAKIDEAMTKKITSHKLRSIESNADDNETLKSIKRW